MDIVQFILISSMGVLMFFCFEGAILIWPITKKIWNILGTLPIEARLGNTIHKLETNVLPMAHLFSLYT